MILKAEKYRIDELSKLDAGNIHAISIENIIERGKAEAIKKLLQVNKAIRMVLIVDPAVQGSHEKYSNLDIINVLGDLKHLSILAFGSNTLENIKPLEGLNTLETFRLSGAYKKDIDLKPLVNARAIKDLELEYGLSGKHQLTFVNNLTHLYRLKVSVLDLHQISVNTGLEQLTVSNTLKSPDHLSTIFPGLKSFTINYAKGITSFEFISQINNLESLQIGHTSKLIRLPAMRLSSVLKSLSLVNTKQFDDMESILQFDKLTELKITEPTQIPFSHFNRLKELKHLEKVHVVFKTESEDRAFAKLGQENGWRSAQ